MSDNLPALVPGGTVMAAALGLLGWLAKQGRDDRSEWRELLRTEREGRVKDLAEERERHDRAMDLERERAEKTRSAADLAQQDLRRRLDDAETALNGWKDQAADAQRRAAWWRSEYTRLTGSAPAGAPPEMPDPYGTRHGGI